MSGGRRLRGLALRADEEAGWRLLREESLTPRTIELLEYEQPEDSLGWHADLHSAVTMLLLLSDGSHGGAEL